MVNKSHDYLEELFPKRIVQTQFYIIFGYTGFYETHLPDQPSNIILLKILDKMNPYLIT